MDIISKAIDRKLHITDRKELIGQTWDQFEKECKSKKIFLFGAGGTADCFFLRYHNCQKVIGVIDNDRKKQGFSVRQFVASAWEYLSEEIYVSDMSILDSYPKDEIVVLITSISYYEEIAEQLLKSGINNYFSMLIMEANRRIGLKCESVPIENEYQQRRMYAEKCAENKINRKKIVFRSFGNYADHGKYITEALLSERKDLDIVWIVTDLNTVVPEWVRLIYSGNWKQITYELATAKVWIFDLPMFDYMIKRNEQIYIQTKHWASITLKKFYLDAVTFQTEPQMLALWKHDSKMIDYIITGSHFDTETSRRGFDYQGSILQVGSPRSDAMFAEDRNKEKVYNYYCIDTRKHIVLYAPTYRFDKVKGKSMHESRNIGLDFERLRNALEMRFGGEWCIMLRLHPSVSSAAKAMEKKEFVIDASEYNDSQELVSAAEITISDYSSIMFEPAFVKKPVFLFATDRQDYIDKEYDLLIDYDTLPFPIATSNEELVKNIEQFDQLEYERQVEIFMKKYGVHEDGHASERVAEYISRLID